MEDVMKATEEEMAALYRACIKRYHMEMKGAGAAMSLDDRPNPFPPKLTEEPDHDT
jgi:hypothetical protein